MEFYVSVAMHEDNLWVVLTQDAEFCHLVIKLSCRTNTRLNLPRCQDIAQTSFPNYEDRSTVILACRYQLQEHIDRHWRPKCWQVAKTHSKVVLTDRMLILMCLTFNLSLMAGISKSWISSILFLTSTSALTLKNKEFMGWLSCKPKYYQLALFPVSKPVWQWFSGW